MKMFTKSDFLGYKIENYFVYKGHKSKVCKFMTDYGSCVGDPMILTLKRPQVLPWAHVFVESGFLHRILSPNYKEFLLLFFIHYIDKLFSDSLSQVRFRAMGILY